MKRATLQNVFPVHAVTGSGLKIERHVRLYLIHSVNHWRILLYGLFKNWLLAAEKHSSC
ncbi:hypothetical protein FQN60_002142, partial [Etheostoma spectabile]